MSTSFALTDRVAQYNQHKNVLERMKRTSKKEVLENWQAEVDAWENKVNQQKERLEALGVTIDG